MTGERTSDAQRPPICAEPDCEERARGGTIYCYAHRRCLKCGQPCNGDLNPDREKACKPFGTCASAPQDMPPYRAPRTETATAAPTSTLRDALRAVVLLHDHGATRATAKMLGPDYESEHAAHGSIYLTKRVYAEARAALAEPVRPTARGPYYIRALDGAERGPFATFEEALTAAETQKGDRVRSRSESEVEQALIRIASWDNADPSKFFQIADARHLARAALRTSGAGRESPTPNTPGTGLRLALAVADAAVGWWEDHNGADCHFCAPYDGRHDVGCPVGEYLEATGREEES